MSSQVIQSSSQFESVLTHGSHLQPSLYCVPQPPKLAKTDPEPKLGWCSASGPLSNAYADTREKGSHNLPCCCSPPPWNPFISQSASTCTWRTSLTVCVHVCTWCSVGEYG